MLPIYYINLARRPDRREYMDSQLQRLGLAGIRIEAVTPADISAEDKQLYCNPSRPSFLRENELACSLSHERAWQAMLTGGYERALILEDDVEISPLLPAFLQDAAMVDADLIRVETTGNASRVYPVAQTLSCGVSIRAFRSTPMGAAGYIIKSSAARRIIGSVVLRQRHMDLALYNPFEEPGSLLSRVLSDPAMCRQLNMTGQKSAEVARSDIAGEQVAHTYASQHPILFALSRLRRTMRASLRNVVDHFAQQKNGLERRVIPFGKE